MKLSSFLLLPSTLLPSIYAASQPASSTPSLEPRPDSTYTEHLHLRPLPSHQLYAGFSFTSTTSLSAYNNNHYRYFPRSLAQILQYTHTRELHLRFSLGRWDEESWGSRPRGGLREGAHGVEIWAWVEGDEGRSAEERWSDLVNSLSGLFCASLNFVDETKTHRPILSFSPEGDLESFQAAQRNTTSTPPNGRLELLHGLLPHEPICTENLTPFLKLLPCKSKAGISTLLDGHKVFDANWQTMSIDVRPTCPSDGSECTLEIQQVVDMVLDIERSSRPRLDPIPRPPPIKDIKCDEGKGYNADDTCFPAPLEGEAEWSLSQIFGRAIKGSCPLSRKGKFDIRLDVPAERTVEVISEDPTAAAQQGASGMFKDGTGLEARFYRVPENADFDSHLPQQSLEDVDGSRGQDLKRESGTKFEGPSISVQRHLSGYGAERGSMHTSLHNPHPYPQQIVYLETLPWFLRPYIHTLDVSSSDQASKDCTSASSKETIIKKMYYTPHLDRQRGTHLELLLELSARSTTTLQYDVEKAILRYTEYPPDANRGFDIPAAVIRVLPPGGHSTSTNSTGKDAQGSYLRTTSLLLPLPTPDFSMPYNVIILTSTVIALGFGSVFNLLVRRFVLVEEVPEGGVAKVLRGLRKKVQALREGKALRIKAKVAVGIDGVKADGGVEVKDGDGEVVDGMVNGRVNGNVRKRKKG